MRYVYIKNGNAVQQLRRLFEAGTATAGGPDAFIADFLQSNSGAEIRVFCKTDRYEVFESKAVRAEGIPGHGRGPLGLLRRLLFSARLALAIFKARPDRVICGCLAEPLWVATLVSMALRVPMIHSRHNQTPRWTHVASIPTMLDRWCTRLCIGVVCHGPFLRDQLIGQRIPVERIVEFDVDLQTFLLEHSETQLMPAVSRFKETNRTLLLFVGRITKEKGVLDLAAAFAAALGKRRRGIGLIFAGEGRDMECLEATLVRLEIRDNTLLLGQVPHEHVASLVSSAPAVVTPTRPELGEGRCMVALEALVRGVPVIAPSLGGFPYVVVDDDNGLLFAPGDVGALSDTLRRLIEDRGLVERLRSGAARTAVRLLRPPRGFAEAVDLAFVPRQTR